MCVFVSGALPPSTSSIDWQYKQIEVKIRDYEKRLVSALLRVQAQLNSSLAIFQPDKKFADITTALTTASTTVGKLATVSCYTDNITSVTCENMGQKMASLTVDITRFSKIITDLATNNSQTVVQSVNIQGAAAIGYYQCNTTLRLVLKNCSLSLDQMSPVYNDYIAYLTNAIGQYNKLYALMLTTQSTYCTNCVTSFSSSTSASLAKIDDSIDQIQLALSDIETNIRTYSSSVVKRVNMISPAMGKTYSLYNLAVYLDSVASIVSQFTQLDSMDLLNETANCNDNNWKIAVLNYKASIYFQMSIETLTNSTNVLVTRTMIVAFMPLDKNVLTDAQYTNITAILTDLESLSENYRQYYASLLVAMQKMTSLESDLKTIQGSACTCNGSTGKIKLNLITIRHFNDIHLTC